MNGRHRTLAAALVGLGLLASEARAQVPLNLAAGPNLGGISSPDYETGASAGFFLAAGTSFQLNERVSVSPFLSYAQKGGEWNGIGSSYDYIEIPVLFGISTPVGTSGKTVNFSAGPQIAFQVGCDEDGYDCTQYDDHNGTEVGFVGTVGLGIPISAGRSVTAGLGLDLGLTNLFDEEFKTRTLYVFVGWQTLLGG